MMRKEAKLKSVTKEEYEYLSSFRYALRRFLHFSEEAASQVGLSPQQYQALVVIAGFPGRDKVTVGELAERLLIRPHTAAELVNRLEAQSLVEREPGETDRRQVFVKLTDYSARMLNELAAAHREELRQIGPQLNRMLTQLLAERNEEEHYPVNSEISQ
ncbi:MAG TPA: helix-turn-helix domain-containing protein [Chloroflexia bacterium]|nr:helix-turn-helix domain-containing protein [Chloroflexia bacterium]